MKELSEEGERKKESMKRSHPNPPLAVPMGDLKKKGAKEKLREFKINNKIKKQIANKKYRAHHLIRNTAVPKKAVHSLFWITQVQRGQQRRKNR